MSEARACRALRRGKRRQFGEPQPDSRGMTRPILCFMDSFYAFCNVMDTISRAVSEASRANRLLSQGPASTHFPPTGHTR